MAATLGRREWASRTAMTHLLTEMIYNAVDEANKMGLAGRRVGQLEVYGDRFYVQLHPAPWPEQRGEGEGI